MKKKSLGLITLLLMLLMTSSPSFSQNRKTKKEVKQRMKELKGWELTGSNRSMEVALTSYYEELDKNPDNCRELYSSVKNCPTEELGIQAGQAWAQNRYATLAKNSVKGFLTTDASFAEIGNSAAANNFYSMYYQLVDKDMSYLLLSSKSLIFKKETGKSVSLRLYYIINEEKAKELRQKAYDQSKSELEKLNIQKEKMNTIKGTIDKAFVIPNSDKDVEIDFNNSKK